MYLYKGMGIGEKGMGKDAGDEGCRRDALLRSEKSVQGTQCGLGAVGGLVHLSHEGLYAHPKPGAMEPQL